MSRGDRAVFVGVVFAGGVLVGMAFPAVPAPHCTPTNEYAVAESLGCQEVGRTCRAKKRSEAISEMVVKKAKRL